MRMILAALIVALACPALAQQTIDTTRDDLIFLASGTPRTQFARAYIPDGGKNADAFARDLADLGIVHRQYERLTDANILKALQDPDMMAAVPASLLGAAPLGFLFEGGYFAFRATPDGLVPINVRRPDGTLLGAVDLGPLAEAPPPVIGSERPNTTLIASAGLPAAGTVDVDLYAMRADRGILAQIFEKAGLQVGRVALGGADRLSQGPQPGGPVLMFMAASQNDPALAAIVQRADLDFHVITNFGPVPIRLAAASNEPEAAGTPAPPPPATPAQSAAPPPPAIPAAADDAVPPEPDALAADLPPARPARFDPADYDAVILVTPVPLRPGTLDRIELVWRFVLGQAASKREIPFHDATDRNRINAMLARIAALSDAAPDAGGVFRDLKIPGTTMPDQIVTNLARTARGLILRLEDLAAPDMAFFREDPRFAFWQPAADGFVRVEITPAPRFETVALADLPDAAPVALLRPGMAPANAATVGELFIASRDAHTGAPSPVLHKRDSPGSEGRERLARQLGRDPGAIIGTGLVVELDPESGRIPEPWPADMILMTAGDLRAPLMTDVLTGAEAYLVAFGQQTPITGAPPETDTVPEDARATRAARAALAETEGPLIALPREDGDLRVTLGMLSPHALFIERQGDGFRLVSNGRNGAERIVSLAAAIEMNDPLGTAARLARIFAQPQAAVLLQHNPVAVPANDLGLPIYDALFDGSRRFVRLEDGSEVAMPTHPGFAPTAPANSSNSGGFCGQTGAFALYRAGQPREPIGVLTTDLAVIPTARAALELNHVRLLRLPDPGDRPRGMETRTMAFSTPEIARSYFASEEICELTDRIALE